MRRVSAVAAALLLFGCARSSFPDGGVALTGARIYPSPAAGPIENGLVLIQNGKIAFAGKRSAGAIPNGAEIIDCSGHTIVAGFWNSHVHFTEPKWEQPAEIPAERLTGQLQSMLTRYGFTSVADTGSLLPVTTAIRARIESGEVQGPRILTAGSPLYPSNGIPYYVVETLPPAVVAQLAQPATPEEAARVVERQIADGADLVKLFAVSWVRRNGKGAPSPMPMQLPIMKAAVEAAHRHGKVVYAHPSNIQGVDLALQSGVDVLAHTIEDTRLWSGALVAELNRAKVSLVPTLTLFHEFDNFEGNLRQVATLSRSGGQILFGTDAGYIENYGDLTREFGLLQRAGMGFTQILASLTTAPAERFGFAAAGQVAAGFDADLVVLDGDPARDIDAFRRVSVTLRGGDIVFRAE